MATSRSVRLLTDERYVCSLCMESFQGRNPKLLPCFHTFCLPCLTTLAENATTKSLGSDNNDKDTELKKSEKTDDALDSTKQASGKANADEVVRSEFAGKVTFDCPTCRKIVVVPEDGVGSLQSNFYLDFGDATSSFARSLPCDMCEDGDKQRASQTCDECGIRLCSSCRRLHDLVAGARAHQMRPLPLSEQPQAPKASKKRWCPSHADQLLCFHCRQCHAIICMHCKLTSHEGHVTEDIMAASIRAKEEMVGLTVSATEQIRVLESVIAHIDRDEKELTRQKQDLLQSINARFESVLTLATRARDVIMESLALEEEVAVNKLTVDRMVARDAIDKLSDLVHRAKRPAFEDAETDVVVLKAELHAALLSDDALGQQRQRVVNGGQMPTFFACEFDETALELDLVRTYIGTMTSDKGERSADPNAMLSLRELKNIVAGLTKTVEELSSEKATKREVEEYKLVSTELATLVDRKYDELAEKMEKSSQIISFQVRLKQQILPGPSQPVRFDDVECNEGNGYDMTTGIFTVPVTGIYIFLANLRTSSNTPFFICVDNNRVSQSCGCNYNYSTSVVIKLTAGQAVSVQYDGNYYADSGLNTYFTGAMVHVCA